jgi:hypothetical protein
VRRCWAPLAAHASRFPIASPIGVRIFKNRKRLERIRALVLLNSRSNAVITSGQYRQHAQECLELAKAANDVFVRVALTELAEEFDTAAAQAEQEHPGVALTARSTLPLQRRVKRCVA